jgi:ATP-dependent Lon protease
MPGRIIAGLRRCRVKNPFFFWRIDKLANDIKVIRLSFIGSIGIRNRMRVFTDTYIEVPFDLSK